MSKSAISFSIGHPGSFNYLSRITISFSNFLIQPLYNSLTHRLYSLTPLFLLFICIGGASSNVSFAQIAESGDWFGYALSTGDFNGDGFSDLAVGAYNEDLELADVSSAGAVNIIYGSPNGLTVNGDEFWHRDSPGVQGIPEKADHFGSTLASCDFDGNGFDDLAIAVHGDDNSAGSVNVMYGSKDGLSGVADDFWNQNVGTIQGFSEGGDYFGWALATGYFDGGPYCDLAISAFREEVDGIERAGVVHVLYGSGSGLIDERNQLWDKKNTLGERALNTKYKQGEEFGYGLTSGDFNGDALDDLVILIEGYKELGTEPGAIIMFGSYYQGLTASELQFITEADFNEGLPDVDNGFRALDTGDFNGDDVDDLALLGSIDDTPTIPGAKSAVRIAYGVKGLGLDVEFGSQIWYDKNLSTLTFSINSLSVGDFNGDLIDDLSIGTSRDLVSSLHLWSGHVNVLYGVLEKGLTADGAQYWHQDSPQILDEREKEDEFGAALATGDFDGNGADDLAIGVYREDIDGAAPLYDHGAVNVIYGFTDDFWVSGLLSVGNQFWHQDSFGIDGDGNPTPGAENEAGDQAHDELTLEAPTTPSQYTFSLAPNYPNPFSGETTLQFTISNETDATVLLDVFDITGKKVRVLINASLAAGPHTIPWNGRDDTGQRLPAGTYAFRLQHGEQAATRMITLLP